MYNLIQRSKGMKNKKGFTLIELIVVIVILGILAAIAIPRLAGFSENAKIANDKEAAAVVANAAAMYYAQNINENPTDAEILAGIQSAELIKASNLTMSSKAYAGVIGVANSGNTLTRSGDEITVKLTADTGGAEDYEIVK